jgi:signal transduction histidine kinase
MAEAHAQPPDLGLNVRRLRLLAVVAPAAFAAGLLAAALVLSDEIPLPLVIGVGVLAATAAAALFSGIVFDVVERSETSLLKRNEQLAAFRVAAASIAHEYELSQLLQRFVDVSRQLTNARYGALSVLAPDGTIAEFITSGISDDERARIGHPPVGRGLLGATIREGALRIDDMSSDPRSVGFPPHHPQMRSLLGVPVRARGGGQLGNLYLTDKIDAAGFDEADEQMVRTFAAHASIAIETSHLQGEARAVAILRERERIGMDLHDGIIQSIYAVQLGLEGAEEDLDDANVPAAKKALGATIDQLNGVIRDVRSYIFELRPAKLSYDLSESVSRMARELGARNSARINLDITPALPPLGEAQRTAIFHIAQDALVNAQRHAQASEITISLHGGLNAVNLVVSDNGAGFDVSAERPEHHRGLRNMVARAHSSGGKATIESEPGLGTTVRAEFPIRIEEGATR